MKLLTLHMKALVGLSQPRLIGALPTHIHFQGYEILRHSRLPPLTKFYAFFILEESLESNWQVLGYFLEECLFKKHQAPLQ